MVTTDQKISEITPKTFPGETRTGCGSDGLKTVCTVYSGLVPMSPNTTPRAPSSSAPRAVLRLISLSAMPYPATPTLASGTAQPAAGCQLRPRAGADAALAARHASRRPADLQPWAVALSATGVGPGAGVPARMITCPRRNDRAAVEVIAGERT